jgi:hypothetical protein
VVDHTGRAVRHMSLCWCGAAPHLIASASCAGVKVVAVTLYVVCRRDSLGAVISAQVA